MPKEHSKNKAAIKSLKNEKYKKSEQETQGSRIISIKAKKYKIRAETQVPAFDYINVLYNLQRQHST